MARDGTFVTFAAGRAAGVRRDTAHYDREIPSDKGRGQVPLPPPFTYVLQRYVHSGASFPRTHSPTYFFGLPGFGLSFLSMSSTHLLVTAPVGAVERSIGLLAKKVKPTLWDICPMPRPGPLWRQTLLQSTL